MGLRALLVLFSLSFFGVNANYPFVFSRRHFYDLVDTPSTPGTAAVSTVLVLHKPDCSDFDPIEFNYDSHILYVTHDYERSKENTWYKWTKEDDLFEKYASKDTTCLSAYYFKKGSSLDTPTEVWPGTGKIRTWLWSLLKRKISVENNSDQPIKVLQERYSHPGFHLVSKYEVPSGEEVQFEIYVTQMVKITALNYTVYEAFVVSEESPSTVVFAGKSADAEVDALAVWQEDWKDYAVQNLEYWKVTGQYLRNLKQPLFVHNYTEVGYRKTAIPKDLYAELKKFYQENKEEKSDEDHEKSLVLIKHGEKNTTIVKLSSELESKVISTLQPVLEEWCKCELEMTYVIGIREYYRGTVVYEHVDRINTNVISAVLHLEQDLDAGKDWAMDVVGYDGVRKQIQTKPGDMVMYESARLIHGRSRALQGDRFVTLFVHYRPVTGEGETDHFSVFRDHSVSIPRDEFA